MTNDNNLRDLVGYERTLHKLAYHEVVDECSRRGYKPKAQLIKGLLKHLGADERYLDPLHTPINLDVLGDALERFDPRGPTQGIICDAARNWFEQEIQAAIIQRIGGPRSPNAS
jgi:hypothetical protein